MDEKEKIFRKKTIEQLSTPDQLTGYLRVTGPGVWVALAGIILLLAGLFIWGIFGRIITTVKVPAVVSDGNASFYLLAEDAKEADRTVEIQIGDIDMNANLETGETVTMSASDAPELYRSGYLSPGRKALVITCETDLADGFYEADITTNALKPISLLFAKNG